MEYGLRITHTCNFGPPQSHPLGCLTIVFACATLSPLVITFLPQGFTHHSHVVSFKYLPRSIEMERELVVSRN